MAAELDESILAFLAEHSGSLARDIAEVLGVDKRQVNSRLYGALKGKVVQDRRYRWSLAGEQTEIDESTSRKFPDTVLSRLARYYLACIGEDEGGVSVFAFNKYGDPDYRELEQFPATAPNSFPAEELREMQGRRRKDKSSLQLYLGYPVMLGLQRSRRSSWTGFMVEPVFLFPVRVNEQGQHEIDLTYPVINKKAYQRITNASGNQVMEEIVQLESDLGLMDAELSPDIDELAMRLQAIRPEWQWREDLNPDNLLVEPPLSEAKEDGIYNRAVIAIAERPPFTQGLESELNQLAMLPEGATDGTALGGWLTGRIPQDDPEDKQLLEVLPMNLEQRQAVSSALSRHLTVITGPPGTGKSQVVTNLLINAAWMGQKVLFASKNNKAVDVVEVRVNSLGSRPTLLRVGSNQYMAGLAQYLISLLSSTTTEEDEQVYQEYREIYDKQISDLERLSAEAESIVALRNRVDELEQEVESAREVLGDEEFANLKKRDMEALEHEIRVLLDRLLRAQRSAQPLLTRLFWGMTSQSRFDALNAAASKLMALNGLLGLVIPAEASDDESIEEWKRFGEGLESRLALAKSVRQYFEALRELQERVSLEDIAVAKAELLEHMAGNAKHLWEAWIRLQPGQVTDSDRELINRYSALLKMLLDQASGGEYDKRVYAKYYGLFPKVAHLLPCWAVTSLSAKGKVPFEPGHFDLVVFDEASQCDIASALPLLYRAKRAVVIGDPKQLSHISALPRGMDQRLLDRFDLLDEHPHWGYSHNSLFDLAAGRPGGRLMVPLRDHHRSQADIIEFSNQFFYEGRLRVATKYDLLKRPALNEPGIRWVDVEGNVIRPRSGGAVNETEAAAVVKTLTKLVLENGYQGSIGVVSPFRAQANRIRELANDTSDLSQRLIEQGFIADTVHKFQGDERDVMVFSPVVSGNTPSTALGFLRSQGNLFNVAITRARAQLIVVGDRSACGNSGVDYLENFVRYVGSLEDRQSPLGNNQPFDLGPEYPDVSNPEQVSDWERILYRAMFQAGLRPLPQYSVEKYILDFALIDGDRRLDIEVDGERYHRNWSGELCYRDQLRNQRMFELGWDVMRFWVYEIRDDLPGCIKRIKDWQP